MDSTRPRVRVWTHDEKVALLAWLDFCLKHKLDFKATIRKHLSSVEPGRAHLCSIQQILQKLVDVQRRDTNRCPKQEIIPTGSGYWNGMPMDVRRNVEIAMQRYTEANLQRRYCGFEVHSDDFVSSSKSLDKEKIRPGQEVYFTTGNTPLQDSPAQPSSSPFGIGEMASAQNTNANESNVNQSGQAPSQPKKTPKRRTQVSNDPSPTTEAIVRSSLDQKILELNTLRQSWHREVDSLRSTISKHAQTELSLRAEIQHLVIARQARELAGKDPLEYELFQLNQTVWSLNRRVHEMQKLAGFAKIGRDGETRAEGVERRVVDEATDKIVEELQLLGCERHALAPRIEENGDLGALLGTVFEDIPEAKERVGRLRNAFPKFGVVFLVRMFVLAALRDWVFATAFPDFSPRNVKLLEAYRDIILTHDGWSNLHNLELAAYDSLIDNNDFKEILVPRRGKELTARLLRALAPLFSNALNAPIAVTWGDSLEVDKERRFRLAEIFEAALHLKASMVRVDQSFEFVIYPPGTSPTSKQTSNFDDQGSHVGTEQNGGHWLAASIKPCRTDASSPRDASKDALVQSRNFIKKSAEDRAEASLYTKKIILAKTETVIQDDGKDSSSDDEEERRSDEEYECGRSLSIPQEPPQKRRVTLAESEKQFECATCMRKFALPRSLEQHSKKKGCSRCHVCAIRFPLWRELQTHYKSVHHIAAPVRNRPTGTCPNGVAAGLDATPNPTVQPGSSTPEKAAQSTLAEPQIADDMGKKSAVSGTEGKDKRRRVTSKVANYREDSDPEFSSKSSSDDETIDEAQQNKDLISTKSRNWTIIASSNNGKPLYKCRLCPKTYAGYMNNHHYQSHPLCLREAKGHVVSEADQASGKETVSCQECSEVLLFRQGPEIQSCTGVSSGPKRLAEDTTTEHQDARPRLKKNTRTSST